MIEDSVYIKRKKSSEGPDSFESIREKGIKLLQEISGKVWTDYNLHDPGVTILEQLILALTELIYLADFKIEDILTSEDEEINYRRLALYKPLEIFPSETITNNDYCKAIYDNINGVRNIWIVNSNQQKNKGIYSFLIDVEKKHAGGEEKITGEIKKYFNTVRNLCEDIDKVEILEREPVEVNAIIEVEKNENPDNILADIYFECFKIITPRIVFHSFKELVDSGMSLDEILSGPGLKNGYIKDESLQTLKKKLYVNDLMTNIFTVKGVKSIHDFYIEKDTKRIYTSIEFKNILKSVYVKFPASVNELKIRLECDGRACSVNINVMNRKLSRLIHNYKSTYNTSQNIEDLFCLPKGNHIKLDSFYSIQNHFPAIFGINQYGVPPNANNERKAKAKQLKGYLLLFEQIMVNFLEQLNNIPELFSIDPELESTYFTHPHLDVPGINEILAEKWKKDKSLHSRELNNILKKYDNYYDRRNRILDFILAMYGEKFDDTAFQQFMYYNTKDELNKILCENKLVMLKYLKEMRRYKAGAYNCQKPSWNTFNIPAIKFTMSLLLGINNFKQIGYSDVFAKYNLQLISREIDENYFSYFFNRRVENPELDDNYIKENFNSLPSFSGINELLAEEIADIALSVDYLENGVLCDDFFRYGINPELYRIGKFSDRQDFSVVFKFPREAEYLFISDFSEMEQAVKSITCLQRFLIMLNRQSEGLHVLEHILLRQSSEREGDILRLKNHKNDVIFRATPKLFGLVRGEIISELEKMLIYEHHYHIETNDKGRYLIGVLKDNEVIFRGDEEFESIGEAELAIEAYRIYFNLLIEQNNLEEVVHAEKYEKIPERFYYHRLSVIFPSWSARFNNKRFRTYVEQTFCNNIPAHLYPEFFWLDKRKFNHFEKTYRFWLEAKASSNQLKIDEYSGELTRFLIENGSNT